MNVSVIIPARNAAETIAEALASLRAQTYPDWEAIVIDDGSSDETAAISARFAAQDARICVVSQPQGGVSAARNAGIRLARFDWLLFLDADDWLLPRHLERMTETLRADSTLDAVYCGWTRVAPNGQLIGDKYWPEPDELFAAFARFCVFAIHACIVRRSLAETVGRFDTSLGTCEDWDLWQRITRTGARFGAVRERLACYRMRPDSASVEVRRMFTDGLHLITQGHSPDLRVPNPHPAYRFGMPIEQLSSAKLHFACWPAGLALGRGEDAHPLLNALNNDYDPGLDPNIVAQSIFEAILLPASRTPVEWSDIWPTVEQRLDEFLRVLEAQSMAFGLASRARIILERLILQHSRVVRPLTIGATHAVRVEITEPISGIRPPAPVERLQCAVELEGEYLGMLELPVCDGIVPGHVLADAIAAEFAWSILGRFFQYTVYPKLRIEPGSEGLSLWRESLCLAEGLPEDMATFWSHAHDRAGWTIFLQELWGRPDWPNARFYDPQAAEEAAVRRHVDDGWLAIEISQELPDVEVYAQELDVVLMAGGVALGLVTVPVAENIVHAQTLRATLTAASGFELCRAAVREGLFGQSMIEPISLQTRLALAAATARQLPGWFGAPGSTHALDHALSSDDQGIVLGRRSQATMGASASRRAMLPAAAAAELVYAASIAGEPVIQVPLPGEKPSWVVYAPDLIRPSFQPLKASAARENGSKTIQITEARIYDRGHFEKIFATQVDPWQYTTPYEQTKYEQTLALLPSTPIRQALEIGCAEGHFTAQLAPHVGKLIAADISQVALDRAANHCANLTNVKFMPFDLTRDPLSGCFDLIVCSEVLYYIGDKEALQTFGRKLADALAPGGYFLVAHANLVVDAPNQTGFDWDLPFGAKVIGEILASIPSLELVKELRTPLYRIQLFQRKRRLRLPFPHSTAEVIELEQSTLPSPEIAAHILWQGGAPTHRGGTQTIVTDRLPILMYHRVAPTGSPVTARYRVTPEKFEEQLCYLRDAGFYSISLETWQTAMEVRKPLPGRAVLITFDDGYLDFLTYAWPLLKRYGFSAIVFLVAGQVGRSNQWDRAYNEEVPLLGWHEIRQLREEGVEFGSHSISHSPLTALSLAEVTREGARSRAILERGVGTPVRAFAYPYGDTDQIVQHLIGACGYTFGLSCRSGLSRFQDSLLALPRIEVTGWVALPDFITKLGR